MPCKDDFFVCRWLIERIGQKSGVSGLVICQNDKERWTYDGTMRAAQRMLQDTAMNRLAF